MSGREYSQLYLALLCKFPSIHRLYMCFPILNPRCKSSKFAVINAPPQHKNSNVTISNVLLHEKEDSHSSIRQKVHTSSRLKPDLESPGRFPESHYLPPALSNG